MQFTGCRLWSGLLQATAAERGSASSALGPHRPALAGKALDVWLRRFDPAGGNPGRTCLAAWPEAVAKTHGPMVSRAGRSGVKPLGRGSEGRSRTGRISPNLVIATSMGQELLERHVIVMPGPADSDSILVPSEHGLRKGSWLQGNTRSFFLLTGGQCVCWIRNSSDIALSQVPTCWCSRGSWSAGELRPLPTRIRLDSQPHKVQLSLLGSTARQHPKCKA